MSTSNHKPKVCQNCGRLFEWRAKWQDVWDEVKYCSKACKRGPDKTPLKEQIMSLLIERGHSKSICPSEVLPKELKSNKQKMEEVRQAARLLAYEGKLIITQKNKKVEPTAFKGPIRLKLS